jgi:Golgi apparatus protein 1
MNRVVLMAAMLATTLPAASEEAQRAPDRDAAASVTRHAERGEWHDVLERLSRTELGDKPTEAIETAQGACASDIDEYCGRVTPGEGRLAMCMQAHDDQLSLRCRVTLYRVARGLGRDFREMAESCRNDIQAQCGSAERVGQCLAQKSASLSSSCRTIVSALRQVARGVAAGMAVYGSDGTVLGQVAEVV